MVAQLEDDFSIVWQSMQDWFSALRCNPSRRRRKSRYEAVEEAEEAEITECDMLPVVCRSCVPFQDVHNGGGGCPFGLLLSLFWNQLEMTRRSPNSSYLSTFRVGESIGGWVDSSLDGSLD